MATLSLAAPLLLATSVALAHAQQGSEATTDVQSQRSPVEFGADESGAGESGAGDSVLHTAAVGPMRFVAVHGRRSVVMGYPRKGLEIWGYPFQILSEYQIGFLPRGVTAELDAQQMLRRIDYARDSVTRTYIGADFLVRERIFVPLDQAAATLTYEVEGTRPIDIAIHFQPVMNLMWPGAVGGQYTRWMEAAPGFLLTEPEHGNAALVGSAEAIAHDDTLNSTIHPLTTTSFTVRPKASKGLVLSASVYVLLSEGKMDPEVQLHQLQERKAQMELEATRHYKELDRMSLRLQTPDEAVNQAFAWAVTALDQAWVCNPKLGCGLTAGYGPSRDARRPQYAWFFAGDGLIATNALISAGEYARAKEELEFIAKYQQPQTGMIWHELSQSAGYIDWSKYPYMYVHVDTSFDYLAAIARYVAVSGDTAFAKAQWNSIEKVYRYCRMLVRDADHLPHIPPDKEAGDEQARPGDDLGLSAAWLSASSGFAALARASGHEAAAAEAQHQNALGRDAIPAHYWNAKEHFWIDGHTQAGAPIVSRRRGPSQLLEQHVFSSEQNETLLDQLASADFQTDWGTREVAASSPDYDPYSYGRGSVTAPSTAATAVTFWKEHRPEIGNAVWRSLLPWNALDAPGHIHEVLAGNFFHEQAESVPEQTWSSAGLVDATVRGLLGLTVQGGANALEFAPHIPAEWDRIALDGVRLPASTLSVMLTQAPGEMDLSLHNEGAATTVRFAPQIPLGAHVEGAEMDGHSVPATTETFPGEQRASMSLAVRPGVSHCRLRYRGGISLLLPHSDLYPGDRSGAVKLTRMELRDKVLHLEADVQSAGPKIVRLRTPWRITEAKGVLVRALPDHDYEITLAPDPSSAGNGEGYAPARATLAFATDEL